MCQFRGLPGRVIQRRLVQPPPVGKPEPVQYPEAGPDRLRPEDDLCGKIQVKSPQCETEFRVARWRGRRELRQLIDHHDASSGEGLPDLRVVCSPADRITQPGERRRAHVRGVLHIDQLLQPPGCLCLLLVPAALEARRSQILGAVQFGVLGEQRIGQLAPASFEPE